MARKMALFYLWRDTGFASLAARPGGRLSTVQIARQLSFNSCSPKRNSIATAIASHPRHPSYFIKKYLTTCAVPLAARPGGRLLTVQIARLLSFNSYLPKRNSIATAIASHPRIPSKNLNKQSRQWTKVHCLLCGRRDGICVFSDAPRWTVINRPNCSITFV